MWQLKGGALGRGLGNPHQGDWENSISKNTPARRMFLTERPARRARKAADRLDGKPVPISEQEFNKEGESVLKIVREIVHVNKTPEEIAADGEPMLIEWRAVRDANGRGGLNEDTARTKR